MAVLDRLTAEVRNIAVMSVRKRIQLRHLVMLCVGALAMASVQSAWAVESNSSPSAWLSRMANAHQNLDFEGVVVIQRGGKTGSLRLVHRHGPDGIKEQISALDGEERSVQRQSDTVTLRQGGADTIQIHADPMRKLLPATYLGVDAALLAEHYDVSLGEKNRVAGRACQDLLIKPKRDDRYGYRLCLDNDFGVLLLSNVVDVRGRILSEIRFTDIVIHVADAEQEASRSRVALPSLKQNVVSVSKAIAAPRLPVTGASPRPAAAGAADGSASVPESVQDTLKARWAVDGLPSGFALTQVEVGPNGGEQQVFSDGLGSVSVFIEQIGSSADASALNAQVSASSALRQGPLGTVMLRQNHLSVTVVGEMPSTVLQRIARASLDSVLSQDIKSTD